MMRFVVFVLRCIALTISAFLSCMPCFPWRGRAKLPAGARPIRVAIAGGSFAGLGIARELADDPKFELIVIEPKDYAEYTPGLTKAVVRPNYIARLQVSLAEALPPQVRLVRGLVRAIRDGDAATKRAPAFVVDSFPAAAAGSAASSTDVEFDIGILAIGSSYEQPYKAHHDSAAGARDRLRELMAAHDDIALAQHVAVIGGGPVGVELAAEVLCAFPGKQMTILNGMPRLLYGMHSSVVDAAEGWMRARGVRLLLGQMVKSDVPAPALANGRSGAAASDAGSTAASAPTPAGSGRWRLLTTDAGAEVRADVVLRCLGIIPNNACIKHAETSPAVRACLLPPGPGAGRVAVDSALVLRAAAPAAASPAGTAGAAATPPSVASSAASPAASSPSSGPAALLFAAGDIAVHPTRAEPLLAHTAEKHAENIVASLRRIADSIFGSDSIHSGSGGSGSAPGSGREPVVDAHAAMAGSGGASSALRGAAASAAAPASAATDASAPMWLRARAAAAAGAAIPYPRALTGDCGSSPIIMDVSLGDWEALLSFDCIHLYDGLVGRRLAAAMKIVLETTKVWQLRRVWAGVAFWHVADVGALLTHRFVTAPFMRWTAPKAKAA